MFALTTLSNILTSFLHIPQKTDFQPTSVRESKSPIKAIRYLRPDTAIVAKSSKEEETVLAANNGIGH